MPVFSSNKRAARRHGLSAIPSSIRMSSMLELVLAERAAQAEEEGRAPFESVESLRRFIVEQTPPPYANISVEMCILTVQEHDTYWRLELIDKGSLADFRELALAFEHLDVHRRNRFVFQLTLWKNRNRLLNNVVCREGFVYNIGRVHSLTVRFGCPCGSVQLREGFTATRVADPPNDPRTSPPVENAASMPHETTVHSPTMDARQTAIRIEGGPQTTRNKQDDDVESGPTNPSVASPQMFPAGAKDTDINIESEDHVPPKRKAREAETNEPQFVSPTKRIRARPQKKGSI